MIIKIDIDEDVDPFRATHNAAILVYSCIESRTKPEGFFMLDGMHLQVTQYSKAGNIFIHVSKVDV